MDNRDNLFVCILYFNHPKITFECLQSVLFNPVKKEQILVIDNGSLEKHHQAVADFCLPPISHIRLEQNSGFSGGFNQAIQEAILRGAKELFFLTNDTVLSDNAFEILLNSNKRKQYDLLAPLIKPVFNKSLIDSLAGYFDPKTGKLQHYTVWKDSCLLKKYDYIPGTALWLKTKVYEVIGGMNLDYFCYWEDVDFCFRASKAGFLLGTEPALELYHHIGKTNRSKPLYTIYYYFRNRIRFIQTHFPELLPDLLEKIQTEIISLQTKYTLDARRSSLLKQLNTEIQKIRDLS